MAFLQNLHLTQQNVGGGQSISIFRMSRESQQIMKIRKQLKGVCLLRNVAKLLAISCNAQNDPRWQTGHFEAYFVGFLSRLLFLLCKSSFHPHSLPPLRRMFWNMSKHSEMFWNISKAFEVLWNKDFEIVCESFGEYFWWIYIWIKLKRGIGNAIPLLTPGPPPSQNC